MPERVPRTGGLAVRSLSVVHGGRDVVDDVSFTVAAGEIVSLRGPNGAGKTTVLRAITGSVPLSSGEVTLDGERLRRRRPSDAARAGIAHVATGRRIFPSLTVEQNLRVAVDAAATRRTRQVTALDGAWSMFPVLRERRDQRAGVLSGGEQQMLVLARALLVRPRVLLLDEPTVGLARSLGQRLLTTVRDVAVGEGTAVLLVEQSGVPGLDVADRHLHLRSGRLEGQRS